MAKVTGPLYSMTASGKIADAMVFFGWKGISVVRQWLIPANKKTEDQGDVRQIFGGLGRAAKAAKVDSLYRADAAAHAGGVNTWVSAFVQYVRKGVMATATLFEAENTEYEAHAVKASFDSGALTLGLSTLDIAYKGTANSFGYGLQLYELAKYAIAVHAVDPELFDREPYTTALADWDADDVTALVTDLQAVV
jgi:hypothetical protein